MERIYRTQPTTFTLSVNGDVVNYPNIQEKIRNELLSLTKNHCSYCNVKLNKTAFTAHIEHFKPNFETQKLEEKRWENLFVSCGICNSNKGHRYPDFQPFKPDIESYEFLNYFEINSDNGDIEPKKGISDTDNQKAEYAINWFGLNMPERSEARIDAWNSYRPGTDIEKLDYPFFIRRKILLNKKAESLDFIRTH